MYKLGILHVEAMVLGKFLGLYDLDSLHEELKQVFTQIKLFFHRGRHKGEPKTAKLCRKNIQKVPQCVVSYM